MRRIDVLEKADGRVDKKKRYSAIEESPFEQALMEWFRQKRELNEPITGPLLKEQAIFFHRRIYGETNFSASEGWLTKFKERHKLHYLTAKGEQLSADLEACEEFKSSFHTLVVIIKNGNWKMCTTLTRPA